MTFRSIIRYRHVFSLFFHTVHGAFTCVDTILHLLTSRQVILPPVAQLLYFFLVLCGTPLRL